MVILISEHHPLSRSTLMNRNFQSARTCFALALVCFAPIFLMAQTNQTDAERWLAKAPLAPPFKFPKSKAAWEDKRREVRAQVWELLGKLPPRPKKLKLETPSREDRGDYVLEKFQFDNEVGATVPGYLLIPQSAIRNPHSKAPAILYCTGMAASMTSAKKNS